MASTNKPPARKKRDKKKRRGRNKNRKRDYITLSEKQDEGIWLLKGKSGVLDDDYETLNLLGSGAFAKVFKGIHKKTGEEVAIKVIDKTNVGNEVSSLVGEVEILKKVRHKYVIELKDLYETKKNLYIVTELARGGELFNRILDEGAYSEKDAALLTKRILEAMSYLHSEGIVHRDLKPENLLLATENDDFDIRIADFGLSKIIGNTTLIQSLAGSPNYVAPEVLDGNGYREWADMWSVGVITYILLCGYPPFACDNTRDLLRMIQTADYDYDDECWDDITDMAKNFVDGLLNLDHNARLTAKDALSHPWLQSSTKLPDIDLHISKELETTIHEWKEGSLHYSSPQQYNQSPISQSSTSTTNSTTKQSTQNTTNATSSTSATSSSSTSSDNSSSSSNQTSTSSSNNTSSVLTFLQLDAPSTSKSLYYSSGPINQFYITRVQPSISYYLYLYTEVGSHWNWKERSQLSTSQLKQIIDDKDVEFYVAYVNGNPAGFAEVDCRQSTQKEGTVQLKYIGVFPEFIGRGIGSSLLKFVLNSIWTRNPQPKQIWLQTSSTDHPNTIKFAEKYGFKIFDKK